MINKYKHYVYILLLGGLTFGFGQSLQDLQKLRAEYEKLQKDQGLLQVPRAATETIDPASGLPRQAQITPYRPDMWDELEKDEKPQHFGYNFFTKRDTLPFWENLPTPPNYLLGPGDQLVISLWGETQLRETYTISKDGKIYDEKVGLLNLTGRSIDGARTYLTAQFGRLYATLNGNTPTTFIDVSLGELRSINVNFVGQVKYPGVYPIHPFSTVITGLIQAGGVDTTGSLRKIKIKRDRSTEETIDLYNYFIHGEVPANIQLRNQDIVVVPPRSSVVKIDSAVVNPGIYESILGETIYDLIQHAGGQKSSASEKVGFHKLKSKSKRTNGVSFESHYVDFENTKLIPADNVDHISIRSLFSEKQLVEIIGQVKVPGVYYFYEGMTFKSLLALGGGFNDSTFWKSVYQEQAEIIRRDPESRYENVIKVNLKNIYNGNSEKDIPLQNLDRVVIHANLNYFEKENIYITGEVNVPGTYPLISDDETLQSIINRAGSFTSKALKNGISIYRDKKYFEVIVSQPELLRDVADATDATDATDDIGDRVRVAWQNESITLMPGDSVVVKESPGTVNIAGQVYNPGLVEYRKGKGLKYYINISGGVTEKGNKKSIIVVYANGSVSPNKWLTTPKIQDGATIIVNNKPLSEPFNATEFASNTLSLLSTLVTVLVLGNQL